MKLLAMLMLAADLNGQPLPNVVLLDFHADYCGPCQQMAPVIDRMERRRFPIRRIDFGANPDISRRYGVSRIPTFIVLVNGKEERRFVGLTSERELCEAVQGAADRLREQRKQAEQQANNLARENSDASESPSGVSGFFDRIRNRLTPDQDNPEYRGQTPDSDGALDGSMNSELQATVRVRLTDGQNRDVGTGTIVHSTAGSSTILTCSHIFKDVNADAEVSVDLFRNGQVLKYPATVLGGDHNADIAFIQIKNSDPLPQVPLAKSLGLRPRQPVFSIGCSAGAKPTRMNMNVVEINRFTGPENILCTNAPAQGRSGGGLFNTNGQLIGVCSGAFQKEQEGLYNGITNVWNLASRLKLPFATKAVSVEPPPKIKIAQTSFTDDSFIENNSSESNNPFAADDAFFDQMVENDLKELQDSMKTEPKTVSVSPVVTNPASLVSSVRGSTAPTSTAPTMLPSKAATNEITVIIKSADPQKPQKVVVIPEPSPWLMQLLTGEK